MTHTADSDGSALQSRGRPGLSVRGKRWFIVNPSRRITSQSSAQVSPSKKTGPDSLPIPSSFSLPCRTETIAYPTCQRRSLAPQIEHPRFSAKLPGHKLATRVGFEPTSWEFGLQVGRDGNRYRHRAWRHSFCFMERRVCHFATPALNPRMTMHARLQRRRQDSNLQELVSPASFSTSPLQLDLCLLPPARRREILTAGWAPAENRTPCDQPLGEVLPPSLRAPGPAPRHS